MTVPKKKGARNKSEILGATIELFGEYKLFYTND